MPETNAVRIERFPGYLFTEDGRVFNENYNGKPGNFQECKQTLQDATNERSKKKYLRYVVSVVDNEGNRRQHKIHQLICEAFNGPRPSEKHLVRHIDGDPLRNHATNLVWGLEQENAADRILHGSHARGEDCKNAKLKREQVLEIRNSTEPLRKLAIQFGISATYVSKIKNKHRWGWLE